MGRRAAHMTLTAAIRKRLRGGFELDVTLLAAPGITMVFGASGSGKTTLLRAIAGLATPDAGSISVDHTVLFSGAARVNVPAARRNIGYVFQQLALFPHMSIADNIGYGLSGVAEEMRRESVHAIADSFRIGHVLSRRPAETSGGERQRAALARSLVLNPSVLLLDEPLSALDHATQTLIIDDLRRWNETHRIPILYVTHSHREVFALGERVVALDRGRVVADGAPVDVLDVPTREPIARLAGFENFFTAVVIARRPEAGTMLCRLAPGAELEVPLARAASAHASDHAGPEHGAAEHAGSGASVRLAIRAGDILLANVEPRGLSARNVLRGTVASLRREGPTVVAAVAAGERFIVHLTPAAVESLGLAEGAAVWLVIKTYSCRVLAA